MSLALWTELHGHLLHSVGEGRRGARYHSALDAAFESVIKTQTRISV